LSDKFENCSRCKFWWPYIDGDLENSRARGQGRCRRHAPAPILVAGINTRATHWFFDPKDPDEDPDVKFSEVFNWPLTNGFDWCGEYVVEEELDEVERPKDDELL
jgi:hypothetical protein